MDARFSRIQFTPDLLPADIVGTLIYSQKREEFYVKRGPIFANFVLADEINRSPAKVQSALLEAMQERQVTIGDETWPLPEPFLVLATQNPLEQEGTYPLPEAQVDRFMLKARITYPKKQEERDIIRMNLLEGGCPEPAKVIEPEDIVKARRVVSDVYMDEKIEQYIIDIIFATREPQEYKLQKLAPMITYGGSPRASISLAKAAKSYAFIRRRGYVIPEDVRAVCHDVLRHRIGLTYEAEAENVRPKKSSPTYSTPWRCRSGAASFCRLSDMESDSSDILRQVRKIEIKTRGLSNDIFAGHYHSAFKGRGMAFSEVREYRVGGRRARHRLECHRPQPQSAHQGL